MSGKRYIYFITSSPHPSATDATDVIQADETTAVFIASPPQIRAVEAGTTPQRELRSDFREELERFTKKVRAEKGGYKRHLERKRKRHQRRQRYKKRR